MAVPALSQSLTHLARRDEDEDAHLPPLDLRLVRRLWEFAQPYAAQRNWLLALVVLRAIQLPCLTWVIAAVIDGPVQRGDARGIAWGAAGFLLLALSTQLVLHFRQRYALELGEAVVRDLRNALFEHLQRMTLSFFQRMRLGRIISRLTTDVENVRVGVQEVLFVSVVQAGQMLVAAAFMLYYDATLFLLVLGMGPVLWLINRRFHRLLSQAHRDVQESFSRVTATLAESVVGMRVTQGFVRQEKNLGLFRDLLHDHAQYNTTVARTQGVFLPLLDLNNQFFIALLVVVGGWRALAPESSSTLGDLVGFLFMANMFFAPIASLGTQYDQAMTALAGAERVFRLLDLQPDWRDPPDAQPLPALQGLVELQSVTFGYDPARPVLQDVALAARPGQTVALVGHTGSGKTTIFNLLAKFYLPQAGRIAFDGRDLCDVQTHSLHRQLGVVLQQNFLFSGTVADNIRLGRSDASADEVRAAAEKLGCLDLLEQLPQGLQTQVGERGASLSLGQRQLVCFARAMLADPRILLLDEATSSIDTITEARLQAALARLLAGRTSFVIAHRLSTVRNADLIVVLDQGRVVEQGRHEELLALGGHYAALYRRFLQTV